MIKYYDQQQLREGSWFFGWWSARVRVPQWWGDMAASRKNGSRSKKLQDPISTPHTASSKLQVGKAIVSQSYSHWHASFQQGYTFLKAPCHQTVPPAATKGLNTEPTVDILIQITPALTHLCTCIVSREPIGSVSYTWVELLLWFVTGVWDICSCNMYWISGGKCCQERAGFTAVLHC